MERFEGDLVQQFGHPGGHMMPTCSKDVKEAVVNFLTDDMSKL